MIILTVDPTSTAPSGKEEAEKSPTFLIEQIRRRIPDIQFRITSCQCRLFFLLVLGTDVLTVPEIVLLVSLLVGVVISQTCFHLFPGRFLLSLSKLHILDLLLLGKLFRNVSIQVELGVTLGRQGRQIRLHSHMQLFG